MGQSWQTKCSLYSQYVLSLWPAATWPRDEICKAFKAEAACHGESVLAEVGGWLSLAWVQGSSEHFPYSRVWCSSFFLYLFRWKISSPFGAQDHILSFYCIREKGHFNTFAHLTWSQGYSLKLLEIKSEISYATPHPPKLLYTQFSARPTALRKKGVKKHLCRR